MNVHAVCTSTNHVCTSMYALVVQFLKFYYMCNMSTLRIIGIVVFKGTFQNLHFRISVIQIQIIQLQVPT